MSDEESARKSFDEKEHFVVQMGVFMPEGTVPTDARRISLRYIVNKDHVKQSYVGRDLIAMVIRDKAEELINGIYEQMDRQEHERG